MPYPEKFGLPCWSRDQVSKAISITAQTSAASAGYFLASHSPFRQITDLKSADRKLDEEEVFNDLFSSPHAHVQAFIMGEPGTGKSHLIRWLFERCRYDSAGKQQPPDPGRRIILVTRGNGSLKDALSQMVRQLGTDFEKHLNRVQGAIDRISSQTAKATLLAELALEIDTKWVNEHGRPALPAALRHLGEALRSNGFGRWMTREAGVIDQVIQRLTEGGGAQDQDTFPSFHAADFDLPLGAFLPQEVSPQVLEFVTLDLKEEDDTRELVADTLNTALRDAIRSLTGLKGADLLEIFTEIRRQIGPGGQLLVLIEDVSVTGLDQDVVNAFERRDEDGLCRMTAILGITLNAWGLMPDNQKQRATHQFEVGGDTARNWAADKTEVARFTARYLNTIRSEDDEIDTIAQGRFTGDISRSRCTACPWKVECHEAFGAEIFGDDVAVGMFPFNRNAPQAMLGNLTELRYRSQRGLLDSVLSSALDRSFQSLVAREFPRPAYFAVQPVSILYWNRGFESQYCSGVAWSDVQRTRLRFLAQMWFDEPGPDQLAARLKPLLAPLGFPDFSRKVDGISDPSPSTRQADTAPRNASDSQPPPPVEDKELLRLIGLLERWSDGAKLMEDNKFRDLLGDLLNKCIVWEDHRQVPITEKRKLIKGNTVPRIEDQNLSHKGIYAFDFPKDRESFELLLSLLVQSRVPSKTWDFPDGEAHKRTVSRWLRKHRQRVVESVNPTNPAIVRESLRAAVHTLALVAYLRDRRQLPLDREERLAAIFARVWSPSDRPVVMTRELDGILHDLEEKHDKLRDFVVKEIGAGQGAADPKDFIDPLPLLDILADLKENFHLEAPPEEAETGYWSPRFMDVCRLRKGAFKDIHGVLARERTAIGEAAQGIGAFVEAAGFMEGTPRDRLAACLEDFKSLIDLQRGPANKKAPGVFPIPHPDFDDLWNRRLFQDGGTRSTWEVAYEEGLRISASESDSELVAFDPRRLKECGDSLGTATRYMDSLEKHLETEMKTDGTDEDSRTQLLAVLEEIGKLADPAVEGEPTA